MNIIKVKSKNIMSVSKVSLCLFFCKKDGFTDLNISELNDNNSTSIKFSWLDLYLENSEGLRCCLIIFFMSYIYYKFIRAGWYNKWITDKLIKKNQVLIVLSVILFSLCGFGLLYEMIVNINQLYIDVIINWCVAYVLSIIDAISGLFNSQFTLTMDIIIDSNINQHIIEKNNEYLDEKLQNSSSFCNNLNDNNSLEEGKLNEGNSESKEVQSNGSQENVSQDNENEAEEETQSKTDESNQAKSDEINQIDDNQVQIGEIESENNEYNEEISEEDRAETPDSGYQSARRSYSAEDWARDYRRLDEIRKTKAEKYYDLEKIQNNLTEDMKRHGQDEATEDYIKDLETEKHNIVNEVQGIEREMEDSRQVYWLLKKAENRAADEARAAAAALEEYEVNDEED
jgi:hypothetical protein